MYGKHHYTFGNVLNGNSLWRERLLTNMGLNVLAISLNKWRNLNSSDVKKEYIESLIHNLL